MKDTSRKTFLKIAAALALIISIIALVMNWRPILFNIINSISEPYDKAFYEENFRVEDDVIYRIDDDGARYAVLRQFSDGFEDATTIVDLVGIDRGWTQLTLLSPEAPTEGEANDLANRILLGESDFLDNRVEPSTEKAHAGQGSLKALAVPPDSGMCCTKASLHTLLLHFVQGDNIWFSAWYYIDEAGEFITLMDVESTFVRGWPGMRIRLQNGYLNFESAKWEPNTIYRQPESHRIPFPRKRWVLVEARLLLSENDDGIVQLWQDDQLVIDRRGQTLPFAEAVYDSLEIGLTVRTTGPETAVLFVDDLKISAEQME